MTLQFKEEAIYELRKQSKATDGDERDIPKCRPTMQCQVGPCFLSNSFLMYAAMSFSIVNCSKPCIKHAIHNLPKPTARQPHCISQKETSSNGQQYCATTVVIALVCKAFACEVASARFHGISLSCPQHLALACQTVLFARAWSAAADGQKSQEMPISWRDRQSHSWYALTLSACKLMPSAQRWLRLYLSPLIRPLSATYQYRSVVSSMSNAIIRYITSCQKAFHYTNTSTRTLPDQVRYNHRLKRSASDYLSCCLDGLLQELVGHIHILYDGFGPWHGSGPAPPLGYLIAKFNAQQRGSGHTKGESDSNFSVDGRRLSAVKLMRYSFCNVTSLLCNALQSTFIFKLITLWELDLT